MKLTADEQRVCELKALDRADDERKEQAMNDAKHTKGEWYFEENTAWVKTDEYLICGVYRIDKRIAEAFDQRTPNGHLIAAAPDLLEALEALMAYDKDGTFCRVDSVERYETITAKAEAAIRKAKPEGK